MISTLIAVCKKAFDHVNITKIFKSLFVSNLFVCFYIYWLMFSYCCRNYFCILIVNNMVNKDEKTKTYCVIDSFNNMLVIGQKL